jgi:hypothetical protein
MPDSNARPVPRRPCISRTSPPTPISSPGAEPGRPTERPDEGDPVPKGLALEGEPSLRLLQKARGSAQLGQDVGGSEQPVLIELDHDVSLLDDVARGKRGHPVVRQVPADKVEVSRVERADVVPDVAGP